jgi:hypothetical protein
MRLSTLLFAVLAVGLAKNGSSLENVSEACDCGELMNIGGFAPEESKNAEFDMQRGGET